MNDADRKYREDVALFRYGVIADLVHLPPGTPGLSDRLREKAAREYDIPGSRRTNVEPETIRHWLKAYRKGGFDALLPKPRNDSGKPRRIPPDVADLLLAVKEDKPELTIRQVISAARASGDVPDGLKLASSTVHRLLARHGLMRPVSAEETGKDRRRFSFQRAGELWMSDVMHGPSVLVGKRRRKTYLIAFLDDATRVICHAEFALAESTAAFLPVLRQAIMRRGIPERLYVDNGAAYRSKHLALVCAKLGVTLVHAKPYDAAAKGKIERWFRTLRMQLLKVLGDQDLSNLDHLNRRLWAWVEGEYHHSPHRGLAGDTPLDRFAQVGADVRYPGPSLDLTDLFLFEARRKVYKDRTVSLGGVLYEVGAHLVGQTITLRYDPSRQGRPIQVWHEGAREEDARVVDVYANATVRRCDNRDQLQTDGKVEPPPQGLPMRELQGQEER